MNSIKIIVPGLLLLLCPFAAVAQEPATTKKQELIRELLIATDARATAAKVMNSVLAEMDRQYPQTVERLADADPTLTPSQREKVKKSLVEDHSEYSTRLLERIKQRIDMGEVIDSISISLYDKYFTEDELRDLITFYKSPTGKKTLSVMPQFMAESMQGASERLSPVLTTVIMEIAAEDKERIKRMK